ncbi:hypothetical protein M427DRAFT_108309 [Gonapodya prolifera JEL478]|uniref:Uncharacterized protein n=1 Tax=Gonapodya prolifera (strain JEL478) TaxID=1344416 RepID=A0A139AU89_GONPJ|nr:hypothetical protein M427DRAFT_108309 [Gonapodya prolifera JEL478]|eukprot:KXS20133.1 hypothetical protein M427DRAFT_108309 [Gonapodya prolifera JEL478]
MGGHSERWAYPKWVWSPAGGWWGRPKNWRTNFAIVATGSAVFIYSVFRFSAANEIRMTPPISSIPSQKWAAEFKNETYQEEVKRHYSDGIYTSNNYTFAKGHDDAHEGHGHH